MASVVRDPGGRKRILFFNADGERKTLRIGEETMGNARTIATRVGLLVAAKRNGTAPEPATIHWLASIGDDLHTKLAEHGLVARRTKAARATLAAFLDSYIGGRTDVKPNTRANLERARRSLVDYFGADRALDSITPGDTDEWRRWLALPKNVEDPQAGGQGLGENTIRRICGQAKQFLRAAVRKRLIVESPFADMSDTNVRANRSREHFVTREVAAAVLKACPDAQWRLLFALSRYGGLRCPSEHLGLFWGDVDWERGRIVVRSPKTEHHEGHEERTIPLFPELLPYLQAVRDELEADPTFDPKANPISKLPVITRYRDRNCNLRTHLLRIIRKAGQKKWPKLFQNLRSTRETELAETFPIHVVCKWIGNSQAVAAKHYLQTTDEHFATAIEAAQIRRSQPR